MGESVGGRAREGWVSKGMGVGLGEEKVERGLWRVGGLTLRTLLPATPTSAGFRRSLKISFLPVSFSVFFPLFDYFGL